MKRLFTFLVGIFTTVALWAVPAKSTVFTVKQQDGTTITVRQVGDEWFHFYINVETGERLLADNDMNFRPMSDAEFTQRCSLSNSRRAPMHRLPTQDGTTLDLKGKRKSLVLLVDFSDLSYTASRERMDDQMIKKGFSENGHIGSVRDYFLAQSYGQFEVEFDVVGPITMPQSMSYYGKNNAMGTDSHAGEMVADACQAAHEQGVNFADYDWNGDGECEMVTVIYAGYGEAQSNNSQNIWPHQWFLSDCHDYNYNDGVGALDFDGIRVNKYLVLNELNGSYGSVIDGIGTFCHEFGHSLDLPDIYDVNYINFGMNVWSIMDRGCYNANGSVPCGYTAYERKFCGWLEPMVLNEGTTVTDMPAIDDEPVAYIVYNDAVSTEYYMLYNVQQKGWDAYAPGHGLLIMHVDYDYQIWNTNQVNVNGSRQRVTIFHADNNQYESESGLQGDPFPGLMNVTDFTDKSTPKASLYNMNTDNQRLMHKPITEISENYPGKGKGTISFKFMGGEKVFVEIPTALNADNIGTNSFTALWAPISDADATYNLLLTTTVEVEAFDPEEVKIIAEDFKDLQSGSYSDKGSELDNYMTTPGWEGLMVYVENGRLKIGSTGTKGYLISPKMNVTSGSLTLAYNGKPYLDGTEMDLVLTVVDNEEHTVAVPLNNGNGVVTLEGLPDGDFRIKISSEAATAKNARFYLYSLAFYDGAFTKEELFGAEQRTSAVPNRVKRVVKKTIRELTDTRYEVSDVPENCLCSFQVQAVDTEGNASEWSEAYNLVFGVVDGIEETVVHAPYSHTVFDLQGRRVSQMKRHGIYIENGRLNIR